MGSLKEEMMEKQEADRDRKVAEALGLTYDELSSLPHYWVDTEQNNDGMDIALLIHLGDDVPKEVLTKIKRKHRVSSTNTVTLDLHALD